MEKSKGLWLNLGCCDNLLTHFVNIDQRQFSEEEQKEFECLSFDLTNMGERFYKDSTVDYILAKDIIEHLPDKIETMNQLWRVLKHDGILHIEVPTTDGPGAFQDPTHVSFWNRNSFFYFTDGDPHRERFGEAYGIKARFKVLQYKHEKLPDNVIKLAIVLKAVKE